MERTVSIVAFVMVFLVASGCGGRTTVVVPPVDDPQAEVGVFRAYDLLRSAGFDVEIAGDFVTSSEGNPWTVVRQWPPPGAHAKQGSTVEIAAAAGYGYDRSWGTEPSSWDRDTPVPSLVGKRVPEAIDWLRRHDLGWDVHLPALPPSSRRDPLSAYLVKAQSPGAGHQVGIGYSVTLYARVTDGLKAEWRYRRTVTVPYLTEGTDLATAYDRLHRRGLRAATSGPLAFGPYIDVKAQDPRPGTEVRRGTTVTLTLDPDPDEVGACCDSRSLTMPNLVGRGLGEVHAWLRRRSLHWVLVDAPALPSSNTPHVFDPYIVASQQPRPGSRIPWPVPDTAYEIQPIRLTARLRAR